MVYQGRVLKNIEEKVKLTSGDDLVIKASKKFIAALRLEEMELEPTIDGLVATISDVRTKQRKRSEIAKLMLQCNPSLVHATLGEDSTIFCRSWTALHAAAALDCSKIAEMLLDRGADIHSRSKVLGWTPLHEACYRNRLDVAKLLVERGANVSDCETENRHAPLFVPFITLRGHKKESLPCEELAMYLVEQGADVRHVNKEGMTVLQLAAERDYRQLAKKLLEAGADANHGDSYGLTPLFFAVMFGKLDFARLLLEHGADVNCKTKKFVLQFLIPKKSALLHEAVFNNFTQGVQLLLDHGADVHITDADGFTPLRWCRTREMFNLLLLYIKKMPDFAEFQRMPTRTMEPHGLAPLILGCIYEDIRYGQFVSYAQVMAEGRPPPLESESEDESGSVDEGS
eukprot:TRINITY_DN5494_c0_g1_i3.p1 TRINITY_DN5494_c0_g1~~TRINITY_DN5494_c0_g1_i3.p1  ORF type:complete len:467 (+),score=70.94 TRINITY_DN5494_c0_g1_i3:204-1403(+)